MLNLSNSIRNLTLKRNFIKLHTKLCSSTPKTESFDIKNVIPNYVKRSPTAILKALSSTVGNDPTSAHFK